MEHKLGADNDLEQGKDFIDSFDLERFWYVFKRSKLWLIGLVILATFLSYLYVRYTKPVYKSESVIKLDFESEANVLGLADVINTQDRNEISGETELIKSRLFLSRVVEAANLQVSYHVYGRYLTDERYKNSPFIVSFKILNEDFFDKPIDVKVLDQNSFMLEYDYAGEKQEKQYAFGQEIKTSHFNLILDKTDFFNEEVPGNKFYFTINSKKALIDYIQEYLDVVPENFNAQTIRISFSDYKAQKARDLVNLIDTLYLNYTREVKNKAIEQKIDFLDSQIDRTENRLSDYEEYFEDFTIENRTTDLEEDLKRTILQLSALDSQRFDLQSKLNDLEVIDRKIADSGPIAINPLMAEYLPSSLSEALNDYATLQQERELKLGSYNETSYIIQLIELKMEKAETALDGLLSAYSESLKDGLNEVNRRRKILEANLMELPGMGTVYSKNRRFYTLQENFMLSLQTSKMELEITRAGTVTKNVILSPASLPFSPIKPQKALIIAAGFMVGLVLGVIFLLIKYLIHNKIAGLRELERIVKVPILGGIPDYRKKLEHTSLVVDKDSSSSISEALRTIRTNMDFLGREKGSKIISITSTISGEGKTFVAVNLGAIMAMTGKRVVVVDIDMRRPKVHAAFSQTNQEIGVSTILSGKYRMKEGILNSEIDNLMFIPSGPIPPNPSELLLQKEFDKLLEKLAKEFDVVILDTPPVGLVTDGRLVMKKSDIQLYIVRADFSKRSFVRVMNDLHATGQFSGIATILNSIDNTPVYGYGYGYGYGYYAEEKSRIKKFASNFKSLF